ncbi:hypothetical protein GVAV_001273 [Gurleya vavrai]
MDDTNEEIPDINKQKLKDDQNSDNYEDNKTQRKSSSKLNEDNTKMHKPNEVIPDHEHVGFEKTNNNILKHNYNLQDDTSNTDNKINFNSLNSPGSINSDIKLQSKDNLELNKTNAQNSNQHIVEAKTKIQEYIITKEKIENVIFELKNEEKIHKKLAAKYSLQRKSNDKELTNLKKEIHEKNRLYDTIETNLTKLNTNIMDYEKVNFIIELKLELQNLESKKIHLEECSNSLYKKTLNENNLLKKIDKDFFDQKQKSIFVEEEIINIMSEFINQEIDYFEILNYANKIQIDSILKQNAEIYGKKEINTLKIEKLSDKLNLKVKEQINLLEIIKELDKKIHFRFYTFKNNEKERFPINYDQKYISKLQCIHDITATIKLFIDDIDELFIENFDLGIKIKDNLQEIDILNAEMNSSESKENQNLTIAQNEKSNFESNLNKIPRAKIDIINNLKHKTNNFIAVFEKFFEFQKVLQKNESSEEKIELFHDYLKNLDRKNENLLYELCHAEFIILIYEKFKGEDLEEEKKAKYQKIDETYNKFLERYALLDENENQKGSYISDNFELDDVSNKDKDNIIEKNQDCSPNNEATKEPKIESKKDNKTSFKTLFWLIVILCLIFIVLIAVIIYFKVGIN